MRLPTKLSANCSSLFAKPVQVFPSTSSFPSDSFVSSSRQVPWQTRATVFSASWKSATSFCSFASPRKVTIGDCPPVTNSAS